MAKWLQECEITSIVMESTGIYWIPAFEILESYGFEVFLVNAREEKNVPGRKTDVNDAQWIQRLHQYGLLRARCKELLEAIEITLMGNYQDEHLFTLKQRLQYYFITRYVIA